MASCIGKQKEGNAIVTHISSGKLGGKKFFVTFAKDPQDFNSIHIYTDKNYSVGDTLFLAK